MADEFVKLIETGKSTATKPAMKIMDGIDSERFWSRGHGGGYTLSLHLPAQRWAPDLLRSFLWDKGLARRHRTTSGGLGVFF